MRAERRLAPPCRPATFAWVALLEPAGTVTGPTRRSVVVLGWAGGSSSRCRGLGFMFLFPVYCWSLVRSAGPVFDIASFVPSLPVKSRRHVSPQRGQLQHALGPQSLSLDLLRVFPVGPRSGGKRWNPLARSRQRPLGVRLDSPQGKGRERLVSWLAAGYNVGSEGKKEDSKSFRPKPSGVI